MSRYGQYGNYYDPIGSQNAQSSGYTYQSATSSTSHLSNPSQTSGYTSNYDYGGNVQTMQQQGTGAGQASRDSANHAAAALSRMSNQNYAQTSSSNRNNTPNPYDDSSWYNAASSSSNANGTTRNLPGSNRTQNSNWPSYSAQSQEASTSARQNIPEQSVASSNLIATSSPYQSASATRTDSYQNSYSQRQSQQPPRYNSPLQAIQAQQYANTSQASRSSNNQQSSQGSQNTRWADCSTAGRQQSASVEPSPVTVDPSQVYDNRAELQRKVQVEAEKKRKHEAEQAVKKAEEGRMAAEKRKAEQEKQTAEQEAAEREAAKKAEKARKDEQGRKATEEKKQSKNAANALQKLASNTPSSSAAPETPINDEEAEMRAMFQKMREFNAKNPTMLAKIWEEERKSHAQEQAKKTPQTSPAPPAPAPAQSTTPVQTTSPPLSGSDAGPSKSAEPSNKAPKAHTRPSSGASSQAGAPIWPAHKKSYLADHTVNWLRSLPANATNPISSDNIFNILDKNPSYVQLCEALEEFGVKFDRSSLARALLSAGPATFTMQKDAKNAKGTKTSTAADDTAQISAELERQKAALAQPGSSVIPVVYELPQSLTGPPHEANGFQQPPIAPPPAFGGTYQRAVQSPHFAPPQPVGSRSRAASITKAAEVKQEDKPAEARRAPANKEEAARKRTFGDLVDLTADDSDEDNGPPPKRVDGSTSQMDEPAMAQSAQPSAQGFQHFAYQPNARPLDSHSVSGPSQAFLSKEMARQVVVPSQPNMMPATHGPQRRPQQPPPKPKGPTQEQLQTGRMKGKMLVEPIMRDRVARKSKYDSRTIARDVLLATGRHPDMRSLNGHLVTMQRLLGQHGADVGGWEGGGYEKGSRSDLSTIRWDIIDPEPAKDEAGDKQEQAPSYDDARDELARARGGRQPMHMVEPQRPARGSPERQPPRIGRPPKNSHSESAKENFSEAPATAPRASKAIPSSSRLATPSSAPAPSTTDGDMATGTPVGYAAFRKYNDDGTQIKKKGRPVGWRKNLHSREAQGLSPKTNPYLPNRTKQSAPKPAAAQQQVEPKYQVYPCDWMGCKAELHNLETLKKHVVKMHVKDEDEAYQCLWTSCVEARDAPKSFDTIEEWLAHVDAKHLSPFAWTLGDGPKADFSALRYDSPSEPPVYLLDEDGRSVTPVISPRSLPTHAIASLQGTKSSRLSTSASPAPQSMKLLGRGRPPKDGIPRSHREGAICGIDAPLKKLEEQKRILGPTMDRMGCVLADEGRRRGFLDDEDFEDEVSGSEYG